MEIILRQNIEKVGKVGDIVKVKDGYARNFLIPKGLASEAIKSNLKIIESEKKQKLLQHEKKIREAKKLAEKITGTSCTVAVEVMEDDKLYGCLSSTDIVKALEVEGIKIDKNLIHFDNPIEKLGIYELKVVLRPEVITKVRVWVTKK